MRYVLTWAKKTGNTNQLWYFTAEGGVENAKTGLVLDVGSDGTKVFYFILIPRLLLLISNVDCCPKQEVTRRPRLGLQPNHRGHHEQASCYPREKRGKPGSGHPARKETVWCERSTLPQTSPKQQQESTMVSSAFFYRLSSQLLILHRYLNAVGKTAQSAPPPTVGMHAIVHD